MLTVKLNQLMPNGTFNLYQLDQSISFLRVVGLYFSILLKF